MDINRGFSFSALKTSLMKGSFIRVIPFVLLVIRIGKSSLLSDYNMMTLAKLCILQSRICIQFQKVAVMLFRFQAFQRDIRCLSMEKGHLRFRKRKMMESSMFLVCLGRQSLGRITVFMQTNTRILAIF